MRLALNFQRVDPSKGGAETYVVDLCRRLASLGHAVDLIAESWNEEDLPPEVRRIPIAAPGRTRLERMIAFGRNSEEVIRDSAYDCSVGFINTWCHDLLIPQAGVQQGSVEANARRFPAGWRRALYKFGKRANPKFRAYRSIERLQYDAARKSRVVAVSRMVMGHIQKFHHVAANRIHVIPNAIDSERLTAPQPSAVRCAFRNEHGIEPGDLVALFVGHNYWLKGLKPLLEALALRTQRNPAARPITLAVCGGGRPGPVRRMVRSLGLCDRVRLLGFVDDIRPCYWGSDFFVSPTYYDPCSLVVLEALACGLPVITTACNGAGELMTDGREGFVITTPDSLGELSSALDHMADDAGRAAMSVHAGRLGGEQSLDRHVARLVKVFEEAAAANARRAPHFGRPGAKMYGHKFTL
jgi:UDP-glucose:(heptosyl)LPS alpha-1,3-glucosyltransferase